MVNNISETLLSSLPMDKFSKKDMEWLYCLRWRIETEFERIKHILELENFIGQRRIIEPDYKSNNRKV